MHLSLSESSLLLQKTVRDFAEREVAPAAKQLDEKEEFPHALYHRMGDLGLFGLGIKPEHGGAGGGSTEMAIVLEELGKAYAGLGTIFALQVSLWGQVLERFGNDEQRNRYFPRLTRGDFIGAYALTEPNAGSDAAAIETTATRQKGGYVLNGSKTFISSGDVATDLVVFATLDRSRRDKGITCFLVPAKTDGISTKKQRGKMGVRASTTADVFFSNVEVPEANRVGEEGMGFKIALQILEASRITVAAQAVGIAEAAFDASVKWAQQRKVFGGLLAEQQGIQWMLADMGTRIEASRLLTYQAAALRDAGLPYSKETAMAKLFASETAVWVAERAVQIHGGYGYFNDCIVERCYRDAKITQIYEGSSEVQRIVLARLFMGKGRQSKS